MGNYKDVLEGKRSKSPKIHGFKGPGPRVPRTKISQTHSNTSLTLKKVHLVDFIFLLDTNILKPKYISLNIPATVTNMLYNIITIVLAGPLRTKLS